MGSRPAGLFFPLKVSAIACCAGFAGIPCFQHGIGVLLRPLDRKRAAIHQDYDQRFAGSGDGFEKTLLSGR